MKNEVRRLRTERGLTQEEFGVLIGVSRRTIVSIEKEQFDPSLPLAFRIAQAFDCLIEEAFHPELATGAANGAQD